MNSLLSLTLCLLLVPGTISVAAELPPQVVVEPKPSAGPLLNPGKGWSVHGSPKWQPKEVLALASMGVVRFDWADLEPREGEYDWQRLDTALDEWAEIGRVCNLGVMCANTHSRNPDGSATPKWVFDAGSRKHEMMLMVGCAAGEGHLGGAVPAERWGMAVMREVLVKVARAHKAALVVWKDFPAHYRAPLDPLHCAPAAGACYVRIPSMPATRLALDYTSFDDYMARKLSHAMRKNLRRKFKVLTTAAPLEMTVVHDLGVHTDEALALYLQTFARSPLQFEKLTLDFLLRLGAEMPERARFFLWRQNGKLVAFSLCLVHDGAIYDEYLGLDYTIALDLHLYFVTFRDILTWALAQGLTTYHSTPLNYDPKLHLGFALAPLDLYVAHPLPVLNALLRRILPFIQPTRAEPALRHFANAHDMLPV